ncbi:MAG: hypothetical protein EOP06_28055 [Proteobacteria bacterium]|nr:MAG: hypothetical protein EOP06_28055 [Pseudomonadota bacterium]
MDKISRILPPSRRVVAMDSESSQPVRPGAPDFGRPTVRASVTDKVTLSSLANERSVENSPITYRNPKETARAKAVEQLAEKFFNPVAVAKEEGEGALSEEAFKRLSDVDGFTVA